MSRMAQTSMRTAMVVFRSSWWCDMLITVMITISGSEGATQNFSVSFDSLEAKNLQLQNNGEMADCLIAYTSEGENETGSALLFIPAPADHQASSSSSNPSYILSAIIYRRRSNSSSSRSRGAVVWMANRDRPVSGRFSLSLNHTSRNLILLDGDGSVAWSTPASSASTILISMDLVADPYSNLPLGTLVLSNAARNLTLWRSSDHPTHALVAGQYLRPGMRLTSWANLSDPSPGPYSMVMEAGGPALYYNASPYWIWSYYGVNDSLGVTQTCRNLTQAFLYANLSSDYELYSSLQLEASADLAPIDAQCPELCSDHCCVIQDLPFSELPFTGNIRNLAFSLEFDGNLRAYSVLTSQIWTPVFDLFSDNVCHLPNYCGQYGICTPPSSCECPESDNYDFYSKDRLSGPSARFNGCQPRFPLTCQPEAGAHYDFLSLSGVDYFSNKYSAPLNFKTQETCKDACLQNCSCLAAFWHVDNSSCFHVHDRIGSLQNTSNPNHVGFLKISLFRYSPIRDILLTVLMFSSAVVGLITCWVLPIYCIWRRKRTGKQRKNDGIKIDLDEEEEILWTSVPGLPIRYSYQDLESITSGFSELMGKGGFGAVYAGNLQDGSRVAVKRLESLRQGRKEFRAEVLILGAIHHYNLVGLIGFCAEGTHRLLVYEYMARGSLDQWLFTTDPQTSDDHLLPWKHRIDIARGAARGLAYLHGECRDTIIHLDIKPQNILLDEDFVAKVSDFGLSTLMGREETHVVTTMRGTPGYLAPEWLFERREISAKSDVFSFGKVLMEILGGRKNFDPSMDETDKVYFPSWLYLHKTQQVHGDQLLLKNIAKVESPEEIREARLLLNTAFLCVLEDPDQRPSMETVVHMLEGRVLELEHLDLADLFQGLQFALRTPCPDFMRSRIEEALGPIYRAANITSKVCMNTSSQGEVSSFEISAR